MIIINLAAHKLIFLIIKIRTIEKNLENFMKEEIYHYRDQWIS